MTMSKRYDHTKFEQELYQLWESEDTFNPDSNVQPAHNNKNSKPFTIMMPPPNANDPLHIGHAMFLALEDIMIRYHRMLGDDTLWLPGTDHAGIETQYVFEKKLKKQKKSRFDFDRQTLFSKIWDYVQENSDVAVNQMKRIGASADWSRFRFMLDEDVVSVVLDTFKKLQQDDLLYRDLRLVNYSVKAGTAYSELEVKHEERQTALYYLKYGPFVVATTRPETIFGDTAIAVHPDDERYQEYIGQEVTVKNPNGELTLKVIGDDYVDPEFGTGAVKITPYHDHNDFEIWQRHQDKMGEPQQVIDFNGRMTTVAGKYAGLKVKKAQEQVAADLASAGLIDKVDRKYTHKAALCYKTNDVIEPLPLPQFFIKVQPLVEPILEALDNGAFTVHGAGHDKILRHWLENLRDWNISRQIVWGIRMPVWYKVADADKIEVTYLDKNNQAVSGNLEKLLKETDLETIQKGLQELRAAVGCDFVVSQEAPGENYIQETDTFDTWFSSAQWPFATLQSLSDQDFKRFYPTQVMETGYDILPFWVMRMLLMGNYVTGELPFKDIYLHGLVRDEKGDKMSKSKGNVINPLEIIDEYGADALRMALVIRSSAGLDKSVGRQDFKAMRNLSNKIWNATRFILMQIDRLKEDDESIDFTTEKAEDAATLQKLDAVVADITQQLNDFKLGLAAETAYNEFWHWYCDECIELAKDGKISISVLLKGLKTFLQLLHPFVPFVTEAVWQQLKTESALDGLVTFDDQLIISSWPHQKTVS